MLVILTLNEKIIEARMVPDKNLLIEGYAEGLQKDMIEQNEDIIDLNKETPQFRFEGIGDRYEKFLKKAHLANLSFYVAN